MFVLPIDKCGHLCYNINKIREAENPRKTAERKGKYEKMGTFKAV